MQKGKGPTHSLGAVIAYVMANLVKSLSVKGFDMVNDLTDTYLILNVETMDCSWSHVWTSWLQNSQTVCLVMQTLYNSTLNETFIIRQIVDAVVVL